VIPPIVQAQIASLSDAEAAAVLQVIADIEAAPFKKTSYRRRDPGDLNLILDLSRYPLVVRYRMVDGGLHFVVESVAAIFIG
jgi:hypothetical protein